MSDDDGSPVVPAATDEAALAVTVIADYLWQADGHVPDARSAVSRAFAVVAALEANGYRIVKET